MNPVEQISYIENVNIHNQTINNNNEEVITQDSSINNEELTRQAIILISESSISKINYNNGEKSEIIEAFFVAIYGIMMDLTLLILGFTFFKSIIFFVCISIFFTEFLLLICSLLLFKKYELYFYHDKQFLRSLECEKVHKIIPLIQICKFYNYFVFIFHTFSIYTNLTVISILQTLIFIKKFYMLGIISGISVVFIFITSNLGIDEHIKNSLYAIVTCLSILWLLVLEINLKYQNITQFVCFILIPNFVIFAVFFYSTAKFSVKCSLKNFIRCFINCVVQICVFVGLVNILINEMNKIRL